MTIVSNIHVDYKRNFFILLGSVLLLGFYFFVENEKNLSRASQVKVLVPAAAVAIVQVKAEPVKAESGRAVAEFKKFSGGHNSSGNNVVKYKQFRKFKETEYNLEAEFQKVYETP